MQSNKSRDTKPELAVRKILFAAGYRYRVNYRPLKELRRTADIVFTKQKIAVFIDGCFWHKCPVHYVEPKVNADYWAPKIARNVERDLETNHRFEEAGWMILRFWSHEASNQITAQIIKRF